MAAAKAGQELSEEPLPESLSVDQAYRAMVYFLQDYHHRGPTEEVGDMISGMSLLPDGAPADPAAWQDWLAAVERSATDLDSVKLRFADPGE